MKVRFNHQWRGYKRDEIAEVPDKVGEALIEDATVIKVIPPKGKAFKKRKASKKAK